MLACKFPLNYGSVLELTTNIITRFTAHRKVSLSEIRCNLCITELVADLQETNSSQGHKHAPIGSVSMQYPVLNFFKSIPAKKTLEKKGRNNGAALWQ